MFIHYLFTVNDVTEFDLMELKHLGEALKCNKYLFMVKCTVDWIKYCLFNLLH